MAFGLIRVWLGRIKFWRPFRLHLWFADNLELLSPFDSLLSFRVKVQLELDFDRLAFRAFFVNVEKFAGRKAHHGTEQVSGKDLELGVEVADSAVVKAARGLD